MGTLSTAGGDGVRTGSGARAETGTGAYVMGCDDINGGDGSGGDER